MRTSRFFSLAAMALLAGVTAVQTSEPNSAGAQFFEKKIRPVLVEKCYSCHSQDAKRVRGGLLLDSAEMLRKGGDNGPPIIPGQPDKSLLIQALRQEQDMAMPPSEKLPAAVIADFVHWVKMGAPDPRQATGSVTPRKKFQITDADRQHWSFRPVAEVNPPRVRDTSWCRSEIDRFILARLEEKQLRPSSPADRYTLLRRAAFDLTGLPPTPADIDAFVHDDSPDAFAKVVDRLLASPEFGVRWSRHWLDGVRYASDVDKTGLYRDWVVRAMNSDLPYDQFVRLQIAGDLLPATATDPTKVHVSGASLEGVAATGMLALAVWERVARDLAVAEIVDSQIDVVGRQFLGLTLACARCHDHKFDPISNQDYYGLAGIFFSSHISPGKLIADGRLSSDVISIPLLNKVDAETNRRLDEKIGTQKKHMAELEKKAGPAAKLWQVREQLKKLAPQTEKARGADKKKLEKQLKEVRAEEKKLLKDQQEKGWLESPPELAEIIRLQAKVAALEKTRIVPPAVIGIQEGGIPGSNRETIGDAPIYIRGDHRKFGPVVPRQFPVLLAGADQVPLGQQTAGSGRLQLAEWLASADNPLTARVLVNRVWLHLFGEGLVRTPDNFGLLGERPTHPELLDYLTRRFVASGWSVKRLIRDIMLSSAYQQSSFAEAALLRADPENRLCGRMNRKRLEFESLRDAFLLISDQLARAGSKDGTRRTLYEPILRGRLDQTRLMFDGADPFTIMPERAATTTTTQALYLLNNAFVVQAAERLTERLHKNAALKDDRDRITQAYLWLLGRPPSTEEIQIGQEYLARRPWNNYLQVLFCTNEFMYLD